MMLSKISLLDFAAGMLAVGLLLCLLPMPFGYYTLIRFVAFIVFGCMAFYHYKQKETGWAVVSGALALLFQPFVAIALGRLIWNVVDVVVAVLIVALLVYKHTKK